MFDPLIIDAIGRTPDGREIQRWSLRTPSGLRADVMNYGATLMRLETPDRDGRSENIVLGFDTLAPYLAGTPHFGATVGRYANRIAGAGFVLDGIAYELAANDGVNHLHGGVRGFDKVVWDAMRVDGGVRLSYVSPNGEEGYPGELTVETTYVLQSDRLVIAFSARTNAPTHVNLTHHSYFNLSGAVLRDAGAFDLSIEADRFCPVDEALIPIAALQSVEGTPFDFRARRRIGERIDADNPQLRLAGGYDHNFVLNKPSPGALAWAATLNDPLSGRRIAVWTTAPGLQFYTGNHLDGSIGGYGRRSGICLEPQHFPNSPNRPDLPTTILRPGETYASRMEFVFDPTQ